MKKAWDYLEDYRVEKARTKRRNTVDAYMSDLAQFRSFMGKNLEEVDKDELDRYVAQLLGKLMKARTVNRKLVSIRRFIDYLNSREDFQQKIFVEVPLIKIQKQDYLEEVLTRNDFERLIRISEREKDKRAVALFNTLYLTGVRVSELIQLKACDINRQTVTICGKGGKYRDIFISDKLRECLKDYATARKLKRDGYLFVNINNDKPMDRQAVHNIIKKYAGLGKVKLSRAHAHNFRHLFCFRLLEEGLTLDEVADLAGHTDINTTRIYTRKTKGELMKAINRLNLMKMKCPKRVIASVYS